MSENTISSPSTGSPTPPDNASSNKPYWFFGAKTVDSTFSGAAGPNSTGAVSSSATTVTGSGQPPSNNYQTGGSLSSTAKTKTVTNVNDGLINRSSQASYYPDSPTGFYSPYTHLKSCKEFQAYLRQRHPGALLARWTPHKVGLKQTVAMMLWTSFYGGGAILFGTMGLWGAWRWYSGNVRVNPFGGVLTLNLSGPISKKLGFDLSSLYNLTSVVDLVEWWTEALFKFCLRPLVYEPLRLILGSASSLKTTKAVKLNLSFSGLKLDVISRQSISSSASDQAQKSLSQFIQSTLESCLKPIFNNLSKLSSSSSTSTTPSQFLRLKFLPLPKDAYTASWLTILFSAMPFCPPKFLKRVMGFKLGNCYGDWVLKHSTEYFGAITIFDDPEEMRKALGLVQLSDGTKNNNNPGPGGAMVVGCEPHDILPLATCGVNARGGCFKALFPSQIPLYSDGDGEGEYSDMQNMMTASVMEIGKNNNANVIGGTSAGGGTSTSHINSTTSKASNNSNGRSPRNGNTSPAGSNQSGRASNQGSRQNNMQGQSGRNSGSGGNNNSSSIQSVIASSMSSGAGGSSSGGNNTSGGGRTIGYNNLKGNTNSSSQQQFQNPNLVFNNKIELQDRHVTDICAHLDALDFDPSFEKYMNTTSTTSKSNCKNRKNNFRVSDCPERIRLIGTGTSAILAVPIIKHLAHLIDLKSTSASTFEQELKKKRLVAVIPGGVQEVAKNFMYLSRDGCVWPDFFGFGGVFKWVKRMRRRMGGWFKGDATVNNATEGTVTVTSDSRDSSSSSLVFIDEESNENNSSNGNTNPHQHQQKQQEDVVYIYLKSRKGFIKQALKQNCPVVPVFLFQKHVLGCVDILRLLFFPKKLRDRIARAMGFAPMLPTGVLGIPFGPARPVRVGAVFGKPIWPGSMEIYSSIEEQMEEVHAEFCRSIVDLAMKYKDCFGRPNLRVELF